MKKVLSVLIALCIVFGTSISVFASEPALKADKVEAQIAGAGKYITDAAGTYGVANVFDLARLINSGYADVSAYKNGFIQDVKDNLDANGGKLMVGVYNYETDTTTYKECLDTYAAVIYSLKMLGEEPTSFNGVDLEALFYAMDPTDATINPFNYNIIFNACELLKNKNEDFIKALADTYTGTYYVMGSGMNYYGNACDNDAIFIIAMSIANELLGGYDSYIKDATNLLENYRVDGGYCYNKMYGTDPNCDSTALAIAALCYNPDTSSTERYEALYKELCAFESDETGVFTYDGAKNIFATKDALLALTYYHDVACYIDSLTDEEEYKNEEAKADTVAADDIASEVETDAKDSIKKSPSTGAEMIEPSLAAAFAAAAFVTAAFRKKIK